MVQNWICIFANSPRPLFFFNSKAKQMPTEVGHLKRIVKSKYPYVESNLELIAYTVWNALEYSYAFEGIAEQLKKERLEQVC